MKTLAVLITCHNRRGKTLAGLEALYKCRLPEGVSLRTVLVDDASTDGTVAAVTENFPEVIIEHGDGSLFWNRGMLRAWERALLLSPDYCLWLNDDTLLYPDAIIKLLETDAWILAATGSEGISVGSTQDVKGSLSYGGSVPVRGLNRLRMNKVIPGEDPLPVMTMNGNCVLVPSSVYARIGLLDHAFHHSMGDNDYGFRAHKAGIPIYVAPGFLGRCDNDFRVTGSFADPHVPLLVRWGKIMSPKGVPLAPWRVLCRRHAGPAWLLVWLWPYGKLIVTSLTRRIMQR